LEARAYINQKTNQPTVALNVVFPKISILIQRPRATNNNSVQNAMPNAEYSAPQNSWSGYAQPTGAPAF